MPFPRLKPPFGLLVLSLSLAATLQGQNDIQSEWPAPKDNPNSNGSPGLDAEALKKVSQNRGFNPETTLGKYVLHLNTPSDPDLQKALQEIDYDLRGKYEIPAGTAVGLLDLKTLRLAMINPDEADYSPSSPKGGVLLAYFQMHPEAIAQLDPKVRSELELIAKGSGNGLTAVYTQKLGLKNIQQVVNAHQLYESKHGGIWVGKHYGRGDENYPDPVNGLSHSTTVRQLLRYFLFLEQGKLVSPEASKLLRQIYEAPGVAHEDVHFTKALKGRDVELIRQWASWQNYHLDSAVIKGTNRHYILVAVANHPEGDGYLRDIALRVDNLMSGKN